MLLILAYHSAISLNLVYYGIKLKIASFQIGYFVGNFFGVYDEWNDDTTNRTFFTKEQVEQLFNNFEIICFEEFEGDGKTGEGANKYWHFFSVIAKK